MTPNLIKSIYFISTTFLTSFIIKLTTIFKNEEGDFND